MADPIFYGKPLTFNARNHRYYWDGQAVPSVTTIINRLSKPLLIQWAADMAVEHLRAELMKANELTPEGWPRGLSDDAFSTVCESARKAHVTIKEDAAGIGTRVHRYARLILEGKNPSEPLEGPEAKAIEAFWKWVEQHRIEPYAVERRVMSAKHMYAGTCDFYGLIDGRLSVLDFKTGKGVYDEAWWQTAGYSVAIDEELHAHKLRPDLTMHESHVRWIVHLDKLTGECTPHWRDSIEDDRQDKAVWLSLVALDQALRTARKHPQPKQPKKKAA